MLRVSLVALVLVLTPLAGSVAQSPGSSMPAASPLHAGRIRGPLSLQGLVFAPDSIRPQIQPTHWFEGALVGAGVLGFLSAYLGHGFCRNSETASPNCLDNLIVGGILGGAVGFALGALIGGQFPKRIPVDSAAVGS